MVLCGANRWRGGARVTRRWEVFPGRNRFWCDGRAMTAPAPRVLIVTLLLLLGTLALHAAFDAPFLAHAVSPLLPAAGAALALATLAALLRTALSDPGVLPRGEAGEAACDAPPDRPPPRAREVLVKGTPVKLKYCFTCKLFRPPRASHCSLCDNCVERFDHHCPWVGNCVGRRNYRHFYAFVVSLSFLAVWVLACAVAHLALAARGQGVAQALRQEPASAVVAAVCFLSVWNVLGLAGFHTYLASTEQTTNEDIKGSFSARGSGGNPYSRGNACANCWFVLCGPTPPSLIDRRGVVSADEELPPAWRARPPLAPPPAPVERHAYMNHSLDLDSLPLQEVCVQPRSSSGNGGIGGGMNNNSGNGDAAEALSAAKLRLLLDTTMIAHALDLDDVDAPHAPHAPAPVHGPPLGQRS